MKDLIDLTYVQKGRCYHSVIAKHEFQNTMEILAASYSNFNENSVKLCKLIPKLSSITINKDIIDTKDVPFFEYVTVDSPDRKVFSLVRPCKIVWKNIFSYCDEAVLRS